MPGDTILDLPAAEQEQMLAQLRAARDGHLLAVHIVLLCAAGAPRPRSPRRSSVRAESVYRTVRAYRRGTLALGSAPAAGAPPAPVCRASVKRSVLALLKRAPHAFGWCRTRWSCAALAAELQARRGVRISQETVRRWLHELGYVWKRARHVARDDDPERVAKLARIRWLIEHLLPTEALFFADELDIHLLPKLGCGGCSRGRRQK